MSKWLIPTLAVFALAQSISAADSALFPCPDCDQKVSRRAVSCPSCGCPGDAIHQAVRNDEEKKRPKRLASVTTDRRSGVAVLIRLGDSRYVIMDCSLLASTNSLVIKELGTDNPINYSEPELANDAPLLRFKITGEPRAEFLSLAAQPTDKPPSKILKATDEIIEASHSPPDAAVAINETDAISSVMADGNWVHVHSAMAWTAVEPAELRTQINLLFQTKESTRKGALSEKVTAELAGMKWLTPYLKNQSTTLLKLPKKPSAP